MDLKATRPWLDIIRISVDFSQILSCLLSSPHFQSHISKRVSDAIANEHVLQMSEDVFVSRKLEDCEVCSVSDDGMLPLSSLSLSSRASHKLGTRNKHISLYVQIITDFFLYLLPLRNPMVIAAIEALGYTADVMDFVDSISRIFLASSKEYQTHIEGKKIEEHVRMFEDALCEITGRPEGKRPNREEYNSLVKDLVLCTLRQIGVFYFQVQCHVIICSKSFVVPHMCRPNCFSFLDNPSSLSFSYIMINFRPLPPHISDFSQLCSCPVLSSSFSFTSLKQFVSVLHHPNCLFSVYKLTRSILPFLPSHHIRHLLWSSHFPELHYENNADNHRMEGQCHSRYVVTLNMVDDITGDVKHLLGVAILRMFFEKKNIVRPKEEEKVESCLLISELEIFGIDREFQVNVCEISVH